MQHNYAAGTAIRGYLHFLHPPTCSLSWPTNTKASVYGLSGDPKQSSGQPDKIEKHFVCTLTDQHYVPNSCNASASSKASAATTRPFPPALLLEGGVTPTSKIVEIANQPAATTTPVVP